MEAIYPCPRACACSSGGLGVTARRRAQEAAWPAAPVTTKRFSGRFDLGAALERDTAHNDAVARVRVGRGVGDVVVEEDLTYPPIGEAPDRCGVPQARDLELKRLANASVRKSLASLGR